MYDNFIFNFILLIIISIQADCYLYPPVVHRKLGHQSSNSDGSSTIGGKLPSAEAPLVNITTIQKPQNRQSYSFNSFVTPMSAKPKPAEYLTSFFSQGNSSDVNKDLANIKQRLDKLEKLSSLNQPLPKSKTSVEKFIDSLAADTLAMNPKSIEICASFGFFVVGSILG